MLKLNFFHHHSNFPTYFFSLDIKNNFFIYKYLIFFNNIKKNKKFNILKIYEK